MLKEETYLWPEAVEAINDATLAAIEKARQTNTNLVVWRDGKTIEITPDEAEAQMQAQGGQE